MICDAIENLRNEEFREKLIGFAVVYYGCIAAGIVPDELFKRVAAVSTVKMAQLMMGFINRRTKDKSIEAFLLSSETNLDEEIEVRPSWHK